MSTYVIFERIYIEDANCIAGFTYGFPAITHFLGFTHALSRKLKNKNLPSLQGCAVVCHEHQLHTYKNYSDYRFIQNKTPPSMLLQNKGKAKDSPSIIEEGKMNMTISLVMELPESLNSRDDVIEHYKNTLHHLAFQQRLAGGSIQNIKAVHIISLDESGDSQKNTRKIKRYLLPGFVLMDRSDLFEQHYSELKANHPNIELIDAWLDFTAMKFRADALLKKDEIISDKTKAEWIRLDKPYQGWLVPITNGYKAITPMYPAGEVNDVRDATVPFCFVEATHTLGEWRSAHRISSINDMLWQYQYEDSWYLCRQKLPSSKAESPEISDESEQSFDSIFESLNF
jgi:CRISPR-associated protein Csy2